MSIKFKLLAVMVLIDTLLGLLAGFSIWSAAQNVRQIGLAGEAVDGLYEAAKIRARITSQMLEVTDYILSGEEETGKLCQMCEVKNRQVVDNWVKGAQAKSRNGETAMGHEARVADVEESYEQALLLVSDACLLAKHGKRQAAFRLMETKVKPWLDQELFRKIDKIIAVELEAVDDTYGEVLVRGGAVPLGAEEGRAGVKRARAAIRYLLAVDRTRLTINRQMLGVKNYLLSGKSEDRLEAEAQVMETAEAFQEWHTSVQMQQRLGETGEDDDLAKQQATAAKYGVALQQVRLALALKNRGADREAWRVIEQKIDPLLGDVVLPDIAAGFEKGKAEIVETHGSLRYRAIAAGVVLVSVLLTVSIALIVVTHRIIRRMILAIGKLETGVQRIGSGDMGYRITLQGGDELGTLAASFNDMCDDLEKSRQEIVSARDRSEQTAQELQESNNELRNFTYIFFHDLREPLVNLKGFTGELQGNLAEVTELVGESADRLAERVRERLTSVLQQEAPEALQFINASVHRMDLLFNAILILSRLGRRRLKPEVLEMAELVQSVAAAHLQQGAKLTIGPLPALVADRTTMKLIVGHLLDNAMKYLEPGRPGEIEVSAEPGDGAITFHIRDNGRGIAHEDLSKVFDIFRRAGRQDVAGEGMGLAYAKTLARRHGGRIWCESAPGVGSTFSFTIAVNC